MSPLDPSSSSFNLDNTNELKSEIKDLPEEIKVLILSKLTDQELLQTSLVDKEFNRLSLDIIRTREIEKINKIVVLFQLSKEGSLKVNQLLSKENFDITSYMRLKNSSNDILNKIICVILNTYTNSINNIDKLKNTFQTSNNDVLKVLLAINILNSDKLHPDPDPNKDSEYHQYLRKIDDILETQTEKSIIKTLNKLFINAVKSDFIKEELKKYCCNFFIKTYDYKYYKHISDQNEIKEVYNYLQLIEHYFDENQLLFDENQFLIIMKSSILINSNIETRIECIRSDPNKGLIIAEIITRNYFNNVADNLELMSLLDGSQLQGLIHHINIFELNILNTISKYINLLSIIYTSTINNDNYYIERACQVIDDLTEPEIEELLNQIQNEDFKQAIRNRLEESR